MSTTFLRLDPRLPLVWESPDTLRIGFDRAVSRVSSPSPAAQKVISALATGVSSSALNKLCSRLGMRTRDRRELLDVLAPALISVPVTDSPIEQIGVQATPPRPSVIVRGGGPMHQALAQVADMGGLRLLAAEEVEHSTTIEVVREADFGVIVERYLGAPNRAQEFLIRSVPHIPVRFTDRGVWVGPLIVPSQGPCLNCVALHDRQLNPLAPVLAAQLCQKPVSSETHVAALLAATLIVTMIKQFAADSPQSTGRRFRYSTESGSPSLTPSIENIASHDECGCLALAAAA